MKKYKAIIYDLDGTVLDTLKMNMIPLLKIIKEETRRFPHRLPPAAFS